MGSFNLTCGVTNSPIIEGQMVKLMFITNGNYSTNDFSGCFCYPWDCYSIIGSIDAKYDDYGCYAFDENSLDAKSILDCIKSEYLMNVVEDGKTIDDYNKYHDHMNVSADNLTWKKIQDMIHSGRLFLKCNEGKPHVSFMAVHKDVYDFIMETKYKDKTKDEMIESLNERIAKIRRECNDLFDTDRSIGEYVKVRRYKDVTDENYEELKQDMIASASILYGDSVSDDKINNLLSRVIVGHSVGILYGITVTEENKATIDDYFVLCNEAFMENNVDTEIRRTMNTDHLYDVTIFGENVVEQLVSSIIFVKWLASMNKVITPTVTSGQCYNFSSYATTMNRLAEIVRQLGKNLED